MNINISDPTPKTSADVSAAYQSGYNQYPLDHPASPNGEFKPGFNIVNAAAPDLTLVGYDSSDNVISSDVVAVGDPTSGILRYYDAMPSNLHHYKIVVPVGYSFTASYMNALGTTHMGVYNLNADGGQEITLMRFVFESVHLFAFVTVFEKINTGDFFSAGYAEGYANYPISNPVRYFLTVLNTTPSHVHVDFWNSDGFLYSIDVLPGDVYRHDISEFPQPVHIVVHSDTVYNIKTVHIESDASVITNVNADTIDLPTSYFEKELTQVWYV
jgi:hypothetical protein